ncbi:MAG: HAD-IA family hydrolase [Burkholderiaceae bacterium]|jgi:phosphoglycolate phosphatase|nr:HAD-IA family hydrolase [Burkholderiaceae bacterium]
MARKKFNLIVFDWDGTLMDSTAAIVKSIQFAADSLGLPVPSRESAAYVIGLGLHEAMTMLFPDADPALVAGMVEAYRRYYGRFSEELALFDGVRDMLDDLEARQCILAVATGKSRQGLSDAMRQTDTARYFQVSRCADETHSKPHPAMLLEIMREVGKSADHTIMIGDTTHDLLMASNAGTASAAVRYGAHTGEDFRRFGSLYEAGTVSQLHHWLIDHA